MASTDITQLIIDDHNLAKDAYNKMIAATGKEAQEWMNQLFWAIAVHSAAEELVVYDALDKMGAKALADKSRADHLHVKTVISEMDGKPLPEIRGKVDTMMKDLVEHMSMEEGPGGDLEVLRRGHSASELDSMGKSYKRTKHFVPTRAHPDAPDKGPFESVAGLMLAPIDKLRDMFRSFPDSDEIPKK